jgi:hypothetical protein
LFSGEDRFIFLWCFLKHDCDQLASIHCAYNDTTTGRTIDQDDLIAVVLEKAPEKYKSILSAEQRSKGTMLTLSDLNSCMNDLFRTIQANKRNTTKEEEEEISQFAPTMNIINLWLL